MRDHSMQMNTMAKHGKPYQFYYPVLGTMFSMTVMQPFRISSCSGTSRLHIWSSILVAQFCTIS